MKKVTMFTTGVCPFCIRAKQILKSKGVAEIDEIRIDTNPDERDRMMQITQRRTVPQIFIGDHHVGGCDDLEALVRAGQLEPLLAP
jgi:glutaredoxin 3